MPNIRQYESEGNITPSNRPASVAAGVGESGRAAMSSIGRSIGEGISALGGPVQAAYKKRVVQPEVSRGAAQETQLIDNFTTTWQDITRNADPNDGTIYDKFMTEVVEPELEKFQESFQTEEGKEWAQDQVVKVRNHFSASARADVSSRAGIAAVMNRNTALSNLGNTAFKDPTSLDFVLDTMRATDAATLVNSNLDPVDAARLQADFNEGYNGLVKAALIGFADANPRKFQEQLAAGDFDKYDDFLSADDKLDVRKFAETKIAALEADEKAAKIEERRQRDERIDQVAVSIMQDTLQADGSLKLPPKFFDRALSELGAAEGVQPSLVSSVISFGQSVLTRQEAGIKAIDDPAVYSDFQDRMFLGPNDGRRLTMEEIFRAAADGNLSDRSFNFFLKAVTQDIKDPQTVARQKEFDDFLEDNKALITKSSSFTQDGPGNRMFGDFRRHMQERFNAGIERGVPVRDLLDRSSKDYIATDLYRYQEPGQVGARNLAKRSMGTTAVPPPVPAVEEARRPGETPAQYLDRIKKIVRPPPARRPSVYEFNQRFGE